MPNNKLIIDLGAHKGEDSDFYLRKGFRVIAIDASDKMCQWVNKRFESHPQKQQFTIFNYAITETDNETVTFYENTEKSVWGTIFEDWDKRNKRLGTSSVETKVQTIRLDTLIQRELKDGEQVHYVKIDIEGADMMALRSLSNVKQLPQYISIESEKVSWQKLLHEFEVMKRLGYTKFKIVDQALIHQQKCPQPAREGNYVDYNFEFGSTGLFGEELPGEWLTEKEALETYKRIFKRYKYYGDDGIFNNRLVMKNRVLLKVMKMLGLKFPYVGWYDTHASL